MIVPDLIKAVEAGQKKARVEIQEKCFMNERIKKLISQCETKEIGYYFFDREKFVILIAEECARIAAQTPCPYQDEFAKQTYGHTWDMACVESAKQIRKHFGVEE